MLNVFMTAVGKCFRRYSYAGVVSEETGGPSTMEQITVQSISI